MECKSTLILGDNLEALKKLPSESVDLCYIDPPFFSNRNYEVIWGDSGEVASFTDRWAGGMDHYIGWLKERVEQIYRVLKPTGSFYLHCDWHADAYIRVHILDKVFGRDNFLSAIDWCYEDIGGKATNYFKRKKDTIFLYQKSKTKDRVFYQQLKSLSESTLKRYGKYFNENGQITYQKLKDVSPGAFAKLKGIPEDLSNIWLDKNKGQPISDWWIDITAIRKGFNESIGYPTQKPETLLERIIKASSNPGDTVLDCFMGGGTTGKVCQKLNRNFIGIDQSTHAIAVTRSRLEFKDDELALGGIVEVITQKYAYDDIRNSEPFGFERFIIEQFGGEAHVTKQVGDMGIDGLKQSSPIQVKRSDNIGRNVIDNFKSAITRYNKDCKHGTIIAFSFGKGAVEEVARLKRDEEFTIDLVRVDTIIPIAERPVITLTLEKFETLENGDKTAFFKATAQDPIDLWQWDFNYNEGKGFNPSKRCTMGEQNHTFQTGQHSIAVRATNNDGLTATEIAQYTVNGGIYPTTKN